MLIAALEKRESSNNATELSLAEIKKENGLYITVSSLSEESDYREYVIVIDGLAIYYCPSNDELNKVVDSNWKGQKFVKSNETLLLKLYNDNDEDY